MKKNAVGFVSSSWGQNNWPYQFTYNTPQGWQCPICRRVFAPSITECPYCGKGHGTNWYVGDPPPGQNPTINCNKAKAGSRT